MDIPWYIKHPSKSPGEIILISKHTLKVKDVSWYLDNEIHLAIYEKTLESPLLRNKKYDIESLDLFNKLYFILHKIMTYADNRIFVRDYLTAFILTDFIHTDVKEKIFFLKCLKKIICYFEIELCIPESVIHCVNMIIKDLKIVTSCIESSSDKENTSEDATTHFSEDNLSDRLTKNFKDSQSSTASLFADGVEKINKTATIRKAIETHLDSLSADEGWQSVFRNKQDKDTLVDLLVSFFSGERNIEVPREKINLKLKTKTKIAMCIKSMYTELGEGDLKKKAELFKIIKCMNHFVKDNDTSIYKLMHK